MDPLAKVVWRHYLLSIIVIVFEVDVQSLLELWNHLSLFSEGLSLIGEVQVKERREIIRVVMLTIFRIIHHHSILLV